MARDQLRHTQADVLGADTSDELGLSWIEFAGHSLAAGGGSRIAPFGGYTYKLKSALGVGRAHDYSIGGAIACRANANGTGDGGYPWILRNVIRPGSPGLTAGAPYNPASQLVVVHFGLNDLGELGAANPLPFQVALRTILSRFCTACDYEVEPLGGSASAWTFTGAGWTDLGILDATASSSGTGVRYTTTVGNSATFAVPTDMPAGRVVAVRLWINATTPARNIGIRVLRGGNPLAGVSNLAYTGTAMADQGVPNMHIIHTLRFGTGVAGNTNDPMAGQTLQPGDVIEFTALDTGGVALDGAGIEADPLDGPLLICPLPNKPANYSIWSGWPGGASMNDAAVDQWKDYQRAILAEFPGRVVADSRGLGIDLDDAGLNRNTPATDILNADFIADGAHPNDRGHAKLAAHVAAVVRASPLITDRIRVRPFVDPRPRNWKKVGVVNGAGTFAANISNLGVSGLPDLQWRIDEDRRVYVRGAVKASVGTGGLITGVGTLPKPVNLTGKVGSTYDGVSAWTWRGVRVANNGQMSWVGGNLATVANSFIEFDFDYQAEL